MAPPLDRPVLPTGSLVLVTGANGLIGSHIVDQFLHYGYDVRGTVRSHARSAWLTPLLQARHAGSTFELVEISDYTAPGSFDAVLKDVSVVVHSAADTQLVEDDSLIASATKAFLNVLQSVKSANERGGHISRVVLTSSSWAIKYPEPDVPLQITPETYNANSQKAIDDPATPSAIKGFHTYALSKALSEQASWKWWGEHRAQSGFVLNSVLPAVTFGPALSPEHQPYPSTVAFIRNLYEGNAQHLFDIVVPQWFVDVRDAARLHVAAAVLEGVEGERVFSWAETYTLPQLKEIVEKEMGSKSVIELKDMGVDLSKPPLETSLECLRRLGCTGWVGLEESVVASIRGFYPRA